MTFIHAETHTQPDLLQPAHNRRVWIIILNWNGGDETLECLETLRSSTYPAHVLVIDNGSQDGSASRIADHFTEVEVLKLPVNLGYSKGVNIGIQCALQGQADYVFLLNNDVRIAPDTLATLVDYAETHPTCGLLSPLIYQRERPERFWVVGGWWHLYSLVIEGWDAPDTGQYREPTTFDVVFGTALLIRRSLLDDIDAFDERFFAYCEDVDLGLRARRAGYRSVVVPAARLWHSGSHSTQHQNYVKEFHLARGFILLFHKHLPGIHFLVFGLLYLHTYLRTVVRMLRQREIINALACSWGYIDGVYVALRTSPTTLPPHSTPQPSIGKKGEV